MIARVRCAACGTEQEAGGSTNCTICGQPLAGLGLSLEAAGGVNTGALPLKKPLRDDEIYDLPDDDAPPQAPILPALAPASQIEEVAEILAADKRLTTLLALIPVWGAWRAWQSDLHGIGEKIALSAVCALMTTLVGFAAWSAIPDEIERSTAMGARIDREVLRIAGLVEEYRKEYAALPDEATWERSLEVRDPRLFDPWGRPYAYRGGERQFSVGSYGRDGNPGGDGLDRDFFRTFP